jgi:hypothetical protein
MKTCKYLLIFSIVSLLGLGNSFGQGNMIIINYAPSLPLGNTADFASNFSGRGGNFEFYWMQSNRNGFGVEIGSTSFYEEVPNKTFTSGTVTVFGTQFRAQSSTPILASYIFILNDEGRLKPYISLGAGIMLQTQRINLGVLVDQLETTQFAVRPEIGAIYQVSDYVGVKLSGKYYQGFENSTMSSQSFMGFNLGFVMSNLNK